MGSRSMLWGGKIDLKKKNKFKLTVRRMSSVTAVAPLIVFLFPYSIVGSLFLDAQNGVLNLRKIFTDPKYSSASTACFLVYESGGSNFIRETSLAVGVTMA